jgi:hypothetical protein
MMQKTIALALLALASTAKADLGDSYAISAQRFGNKGIVDKATQSVNWLGNSQYTTVSEQFHHNQCCAILYIPTRGNHILESEIWRLLQRNVKTNVTWTEYTDPNAPRAWVSSEGTIYAELLESGVVRVAYKSWLVRHGLLGVPAMEQPAMAPVEDDAI